MTSHYLRPSRNYRLGRMSYATVDSKTGKSLTTKARLLDFQVKVGAVPKDGLWTISTGEWTTEMAVRRALASAPGATAPPLLTGTD